MAARSTGWSKLVRASIAGSNLRDSASVAGDRASNSQRARSQTRPGVTGESRRGRRMAARSSGRVPGAGGLGPDRNVGMVASAASKIDPSTIANNSVHFAPGVVPYQCWCPGLTTVSDGAVISVAPRSSRYWPRPEVTSDTTMWSRVRISRWSSGSASSTNPARRIWPVLVAGPCVMVRRSVVAVGSDGVKITRSYMQRPPQLFPAGERSWTIGARTPTTSKVPP